MLVLESIDSTKKRETCLLSEGVEQPDCFTQLVLNANKTFVIDALDPRSPASPPTLQSWATDVVIFFLIWGSLHHRPCTANSEVGGEGGLGIITPTTPYSHEICGIDFRSASKVSFSLFCTVYGLENKHSKNTYFEECAFPKTRFL